MQPVSPDVVSLAQSGDRRAIDTVVRSVKPYVQQQATRFAKRYRHMLLEDLVAEGLLGVMRALHKYETGHGTTFLTYARAWIDAQIREAIARDVSPITACTRTKGIVARGVDCSDPAVAKRNRLGRQTVATMHWLSPRAAVGLDAPLGEGGTYHDVIGGGEGEDALLEAIDSRRADADVRARISRLRLKDLERAVLNERLMAENAVTLAELGARFGVSRERVRQVEVRMRQRVNVALRRSVTRSECEPEPEVDPEEWLWLPGCEPRAMEASR